MDSVPVSLIESKIADIELQIQHLSITRDALKEILKTEQPPKSEMSAKQGILKVLEDNRGKKLKLQEVWEQFQSLNIGSQRNTVQVALIEMRKSPKYPVAGEGQLYWIQ